MTVGSTFTTSTLGTSSGRSPAGASPAGSSTRKSEDAARGPCTAQYGPCQPWANRIVVVNWPELRLPRSLRRIRECCLHAQGVVRPGNAGVVAFVSTGRCRQRYWRARKRSRATRQRATPSRGREYSVDPTRRLRDLAAPGRTRRRVPACPSADAGVPQRLPSAQARPSSTTRRGRVQAGQFRPATTWSPRAKASTGATFERNWSPGRLGPHRPGPQNSDPARDAALAAPLPGPRRCRARVRAVEERMEPGAAARAGHRAGAATRRPDHPRQALLRARQSAGSIARGLAVSWTVRR